MFVIIDKFVSKYLFAPIDIIYNQSLWLNPQLSDCRIR